MEDLDFAKAEGKEYFRAGPITSNELGKSENRGESWLNFWTFFTTCGIKTRYAYDFSLCFPHELIMRLRTIHF